MSVRIGHASMGSNGSIKGDIAGDQNGKEVCIRTWYNKPWVFVLRFNDRAKAKKAVANCIALCNNPCIGYDQSNRNSLQAELKKVNWKIGSLKTPCETDCSAFQTVICESVGIKIPYSYGNAPTTSTMVNAFKSTGAFEVLTDSRYLTSDKYLLEGDILVKPGSHTVMVLDNGNGGGNVTPAPQTYKIGQTYTLNANMFVRLTPGGEKKLYSEFSANAKQNGYADTDGSGILKKGTRVTCQGIQIIGTKTWMRIPSGYICAISGSTIYAS